MSYVPRRYEEIVRDLLTTLTGGTVRESVPVPDSPGPITLPRLLDRPVRRVSHLEGVTLVGQGENEKEIPYRFTSADFELIATSGDDSQKDAIIFRDEGRLPAPGSTLLVNYYPVQTNPVPLTDLNVGSVVRTLMETAARELALTYLQLDQVYKAAFLETAEGSALDKVVALVGVRRLLAGHPVVKIRFTRQAGAGGRITVPAGTPVTNQAGDRYLTLEALTLEPGETTRQVMAGGEGPGTAVVAEGELDRLEVAIAGVSAVSNPEPARQLSAPETDDELRRRAPGALHGVVRGTVDALRFGLLSVPGVKDVTIIEAPNGVAGEVRLEIAYSQEDDETRQLVDQRIRELRPAGIRVIYGEAVRKRVSARIALTLAGAGLSGAELSDINAGVEQRIKDYMTALPPGDAGGGVKVRRAKLLALVLQDDRIVDAAVLLLPEGEAESEELTLAAGQVLEVVTPFDFETPAYEQALGAEPAITALISIVVPLHLAAGVTQAAATEAITLATDSYLNGRGPESPLTVDSYIAAIRDDTRYAVVRAEVVATVETADGRFLQLTDGLGDYQPAPNEKLQRQALDIAVKEGLV